MLRMDAGRPVLIGQWIGVSTTGANRDVSGEMVIQEKGTAERLERRAVGVPRSSWRGIGLTAVLVGLVVTNASAWLLLLRDWSVLDYVDVPFFAFEKADGQFDSPVLRQALVLLIVLGVSYAGVLAAMRSVRALTPVRRATLAASIAVAALASVLLYPVGALDVFNYLVELKLAFHYDQNPYLVTFEAYKDDSFARSAFLVDLPLFYGPVWLIVSGLPLLLTGFGGLLQALLALKVYNLGLLGIIATLIAMQHSDARARWTGIVFFLLNPLILFEGVANVHNDVLMTVFIVAGMVSLKRRSLMAGPLLALAVMVKLYAAALAPLFIAVALRDRWPWKRAVLTTVLAVAAMAAVSLPYWSDGKMVDGFEAGLEQSQHMDHVSPLSLTQQWVQQGIAEDRPDTIFVRSRPAFEILPEDTADGIRRGYMEIFAGLTIALALSAWKGRAEEIVAAETLLLLLLFTTNLYAWYLIPVIAMFALRRDWLSTAYVVVASILGLAYYPMYVYAHYNTEWSRFDVHLFLAQFLTVPILIYLLARMMNGLLLAWKARRCDKAQVLAGDADESTRS